MRLIQLTMALLITIVGVPAFGQYYLFDAEDDGVAFEYARGDAGEISADGFVLTVKSAVHSGVFVTYIKAGAPNGPGLKNYALGYERYISPNTSAETHPVTIAPIAINNTDYPGDLSATAIVPSVSLGLMFPLGEIGRNVSAAGLSAWIPLTSSDGLDPDIVTAATFSTSQAIPVSPQFAISAGAAYSVEFEEDADNTFEFKVGLVYRTKKADGK